MPCMIHPSLYKKRNTLLQLIIPNSERSDKRNGLVLFDELLQLFFGGEKKEVFVIQLL